MMYGSSIVNTLIIKLSAHPLTRSPHEPVDPCPTRFFSAIACFYWFRPDCRSLSHRSTHLRHTEECYDFIRPLGHSGAPTHEGSLTYSSQPQPPHLILVYARQHSPGSDSFGGMELAHMPSARDTEASDWWISPIGVKYENSLL